MFLVCVFLIFVAVPGLGQQPSPFEVLWNTTHSFGYDGPWQAIPISVGDDAQPLNLYPGGAWATTLPSSHVYTVDGFSADGFVVAPPGGAGVYNANLTNPKPDGSTTEDNGIFSQQYSGPVIPIDGSWGGEDAIGLKGAAIGVTDSIQLPQGFQNTNTPSVSISAVYSANYTLPNGVVVPENVGLFSLGQATDQHWGQVNGTMISRWLAATQQTPSNSWGLHIGSATMEIPGSLVFGGYDEARVIGDVGSYSSLGINGDLIVSLVDIGIGVASGGSPFPFNNLAGMLRDDASNATGQVQVRINPTVPQLYLPGNTCATIAKHLPVSLDASTGFYFWNTNDPLYKKITTSPAYLQFIFQRVGAETDLAIKVPFSLLDLALTSPIVNDPTKYFPCKTTAANTDEQTNLNLGRAFLQAAFIGMSWDTLAWYMAQAPGPANLQPSITTIVNHTTQISSIANASLWLESWSSAWTPLPTTSGNLPTTSGKGGLSTGAIAGIAVVGAIVGLAVLGGIFFWFCYRGRQRSKAHKADTAMNDPGWVAQITHMDKPELDSTQRNNQTNHMSYVTSPSDRTSSTQPPVYYEMADGSPQIGRISVPPEGVRAV